MHMTKTELIEGLDEFTKAYLEAALWSSTNENYTVDRRSQGRIAYLKEKQNMLLGTYKRLRSQGYTAKSAYSAAKTRVAWQAAECGEHNEPRFESACVRLKIVPDEYADMDDLKGDSFNPAVNDNIPAARLAREEKEFENKVNRDGVWGVIGEYWNGEKWIVSDSRFGFVGDDWKESGYDDDIKACTLAAFEEFYADMLAAV